MLSVETVNVTVCELSGAGPGEIPAAQPATACGPESSSTTWVAPAVKLGATLTNGGGSGGVVVVGGAGTGGGTVVVGGTGGTVVVGGVTVIVGGAGGVGRGAGAGAGVVVVVGGAGVGVGVGAAVGVCTAATLPPVGPGCRCTGACRTRACRIIRNAGS